MVAERVSWTGQCHARYRPSLSTSASVMISGSLIARRPMRVAVYISGGATLFDLIRYAADIIRGVFGVFGFNLDCDFHGSRLLASCCNRVDRRRRTTAPISATARDLFMIPNASRTTGTRCAATQITHGRYATSATTDNATALHQATIPGILFSGRRDTLFGSTRSRMVSNFTSACCTSCLARGNAQGQTHSETSSNYLCINDDLGTGGMTPTRPRGRPGSDMPGRPARQRRPDRRQGRPDARQRDQPAGSRMVLPIARRTSAPSP